MLSLATRCIMSPPPIALLSPSGQELSSAFRAALQTSFNNFDLNRDGALCHAEAAAFFTAVGDGPLTEEAFGEIGELVQCDERGRLTFEGLVEMFQSEFEESQSAGDAYAWKPVLLFPWWLPPLPLPLLRQDHQVHLWRVTPSRPLFECTGACNASASTPGCSSQASASAAVARAR